MVTGQHGPTGRWLDRAAGPVVRPYVLTGGRTVPGGRFLDLIDILAATGDGPAQPARLGSQQRRILSLCGRPISFADLVSELDLPVMVARVLAGDLADQGMLTILAAPRGPVTDPQLLSRVLEGLRSL
jgi:Protein of unknown function (DUF742)